MAGGDQIRRGCLLLTSKRLVLDHIQPGFLENAVPLAHHGTLDDGQHDSRIARVVGAKDLVAGDDFVARIWRLFADLQLDHVGDLARIG